MKKLLRIGNNLNAFSIQFDNKLLDEIRASYNKKLYSYVNSAEFKAILEGGKNYDQAIDQASNEYHLTSFGSYPLLWLACNTAETYDLYKRFFDNLNIEDEIKQLVDYDEKIIMYCGFLVVSDRASDYSWHVDYNPGSNAYTFITPLFELDDDHGNLLYETSDKEQHKYHYKLNEAVIFGDTFRHSTEPYPVSNKIRILLSFTCGTDKIKYWPILKNTIGDQSNFFILPCGHRFGTCQCMDSIVDEMPKPSRNSPCFCGSQIKYKHCHGKLV